MLELDRGEKKRDEWVVPYSGEQLAKAAFDKKEYHTGRLKCWREKKEEVIKEIQTSGITVTETLVDELAKAGYANTMSMGGGPLVQIDAALQAHLREAHDKVKAHERLVSQYGAWQQMMESPAAKPRTFELTQNDWMYFFGR
jgi:hypothetical protein